MERILNIISVIISILCMIGIVYLYYWYLSKSLLKEGEIIRNIELIKHLQEHNISSIEVRINDAEVNIHKRIDEVDKKLHSKVRKSSVKSKA